MPRKPNSPETRATDALAKFLKSDLQYVIGILEFVFGKKIPKAFLPYDTLRITTERKGMETKSMDLVIENDAAALVFEMKIQAREDCGQYTLYHDIMHRTGKKAWVVGILNSVKSDELLDDAAFKRLTWSSLWKKLSSIDSSPSSPKKLDKLQTLLEDEGVALSVQNKNKNKNKITRTIPRNSNKDIKFLPGNPTLMKLLFSEVVSVWKGDIDSRVLTTGNTPIHLRLGWKYWASKFKQPSSKRLIVGLNYPGKRPVPEPIFYFQSEFYHKSYFNDFESFKRTWGKAAPAFVRLGYKPRGNSNNHSSFSHTDTFETIPVYFSPPKFCYMEHTKFSSNLAESVYARLGWDGLVKELRKRILLMKSHIDSIVIK